LRSRTEQGAHIAATGFCSLIAHLRWDLLLELTRIRYNRDAAEEDFAAELRRQLADRNRPRPNVAADSRYQTGGCPAPACARGYRVSLRVTSAGRRPRPWPGAELARPRPRPRSPDGRTLAAVRDAGTRLLRTTRHCLDPPGSDESRHLAVFRHSAAPGEDTKRGLGNPAQCDPLRQCLSQLQRWEVVLAAPPPPSATRPTIG
jgi:hypothetical protein